MLRTIASSAGKRTTLGTLGVTLPPDSVSTVRLPISPDALTILRRRYRYVAELRVQFHGAGSKAFTTRVTLYPSAKAGLGWARTLPGQTARLMQHTSAGLVRSAVVIMSGPSDSDGAWAPVCSGTKIATAGGPLILTAAHCSRDPVQSVFGPEPPPAPQDSVVYDYVGLGDTDYAIADAGASRSERTLAPVAIVDGIAVHFESQGACEHCQS